MHTSLGSAVLSAMGVTGARAHELLASGQTNLQETNALVWVMVAISATGAIITFAFLAYSLWRFRDPRMKDRRYG